MEFRVAVPALIYLSVRLPADATDKEAKQAAIKACSDAGMDDGMSVQTHFEENMDAVAYFKLGRDSEVPLRSVSIEDRGTVEGGD